MVIVQKYQGHFYPTLESLPYDMLFIATHPGNVCGPHDRFTGDLSVYILCHDQHFVAVARK